MALSAAHPCQARALARVGRTLHRLAAPSPSLDRNTFLAEVERLYAEGYPTREIAQLLGEDDNKVGSNLREIKRRWARAAGRQRTAVSQTQCAAVYREAMNGWRRSQQPKLTTTEHRDANGKPVKTTIRRQEGPSDKTFLQSAVAALKALRQFAQAGSPSDKDRDAGDPVYLAILETMTQEQADNLKHEHLPRVRLAVDRLQAEIERFHAEVEAFRREKAGEGHDGPASGSTANDRAAPSQPAPHEPGEKAGRDGVEVASRGFNNAAGRRIDGPGETAPPADDLQAAAAPQEQADEPPILAAHAKQQPEPAGPHAVEPASCKLASGSVICRERTPCLSPKSQNAAEGVPYRPTDEAAMPPVGETAVSADSPAEEMREHASRVGQDCAASAGPPSNDPDAPALASSLVRPYTVVPRASPSPVLIGGPRTAPPTAAEHQAFQQWMEQQFGIARYNVLPAQGLRQTPGHAPPAASLAGGARGPS